MKKIVSYICMVLIYGTCLKTPAKAYVDFPRWCLEVYQNHERINDLYAAQEGEENTVNSHHGYEEILGLVRGPDWYTF